MKIASLIAFVCVFLTAPCMAWGPAHAAMTGAALEVQPDELKAIWSELHVDPFDQTERPLSWFLSSRFSQHPDAVDGPCANESDIPKRLRATRFVFAQREGKFMAPIAYSDPNKDSKGPRPKTYHYFTLKTEELNRIFAEKGARWYFEKIARSLNEGKKADAAEFLGAFAHAIEDRVSPYHVWDGFADQREAIESAYPELQSPEGSWKGSPKSTSLIWALAGKGVTVDLGSYQPKSLGANAAAAAKTFTARLFQSREHARKIYSAKGGYIEAHLQDDWKNRTAGPATIEIMSQIASENAELVADVIYTACSLSKTL